IIIRTIEHFENHPQIDGICVVCIEPWIGHLKKLLKRYDIQKVTDIVPGGRDGQGSIRNGLYAIERRFPAAADVIVLIHDGVRPLIDAQLITDNIACVREHGSAITIVPATETIATIDECKRVTGVTDRAMYYIARAPQSFYLADILKAHQKAVAEGIASTMIDSAMLMTHYGYKLYTVEGPQENIKVTTPSDFYVCRALLQAKENAQIWG
ncbi:MAG: 2-C-methyl-D-erythritol 4-phosphate cytidylyltransferase, partial [Butyricicoccus sp.]